MTQDIGWTTPTEVVRARVRELRRGRGMSARELAERCAEAGYPALDRSVIANFESGRRATISLEEMLVLALVLDVAPVHLFVPLNNDLGLAVGKWVVGPGVAREWVRGRYPLPSQADRTYWTEVPDEEWDASAPREPRRQATPEELRELFGEDNIHYVGPPPTVDNEEA